MKTVIILGPGYPSDQLLFRKRLARMLEKGGLRAILMEEYVGRPKRPLHQEFESLLDDANPDLIVAMYMKTKNSNAVDFELGAITCKKLAHKDGLLILVQKGLDEKYITRYVSQGLYHILTSEEFCNETDAYDRILYFLNRPKATSAHE